MRCIFFFLFIIPFFYLKQHNFIILVLGSFEYWSMGNSWRSKSLRQFKHYKFRWKQRPVQRYYPRQSAFYDGSTKRYKWSFVSSLLFFFFFHFASKNLDFDSSYQDHPVVCNISTSTSLYFSYAMLKLLLNIFFIAFLSITHSFHFFLNYVFSNSSC